MTTTGEELARALELEEVPSELEPRFNIAPTQSIAVVVAGPSARELGWRQWGLVPHWADDPAVGARMINARSETAAEKPAFRQALEKRRCAIPATGFYEWARSGPRRGPVWFHAADAVPFAMAGLWERWEGPGGRILETAAILTTEANRTVAPTHHRMPVILDAAALAEWLEPGALSTENRSELLRPCADDRLAERAVSTRVNDATVDDPGCLDEAKPPGLGPLFDGLGGEA